jgi:hypothetical protein
MALGGSGHADAINSYPTRAACFTDLRDHAVRLMKRRGRHGLHGCCQGQGKSNSDQPDHFVSPLRTFNLEEWKTQQQKASNQWGLIGRQKRISRGAGRENRHSKRAHLG